MGTPCGLSYYECGSNTFIAFMFACPGWHEEFHRRPAAGDTGRNLHLLLDTLRSWQVPGIPTREELTICNSWTQVIYEEQNNGRTLPNLKWIRRPANLERLKNELAGLEGWLICSGPHAQDAGARLVEGRYLADTCSLLYIPHLSSRGINNRNSGLSTDISGEPITKERVKKAYMRNRLRIEALAAAMLRAMDLKDYIPVTETVS